MNKNLLANVEGKTPALLVNNGCRKQGRGVLGLMLLAVFAVFFGGTAWAQDDFTGIWYIANELNHSSTIDKQWCLVPAANPRQEHYADAYFNNQYCNTGGSGDYTGTNYGDPEKPFITTYQTSQDDNSAWIITAVSDESGIYNIIHAATGKYLVYEPPYKDAINRKSMHLETISGTPGENAKFAITGSLDGPINIRPKSLNDGNRFFNPAGSNANRYYGTGTTYYHEGMVGVWSGSDGNSQWYLKKAAPIITFTTDDKVRINASVNIGTVYYTTNDTEPTTSSTPYTGEFTPGADATCIKAIVVINGVESNVATAPVLPGESRSYLIRNLGYVNAPEEGFYMQPGDLDNNNIRVTTSSVARPLMKWYFKSAGVEKGLQYFYIVNPESEDNYLCCTLEGTSYNNYMKTAADFDGGNDYKFRILTDANASYDGYRIVPKSILEWGELGTSTADKRWLNKANGNNSPNLVTTYTSVTNLDCRWDFIPIFNNQMPATTPPFVPMTSPGGAYYKIVNAGATDYFIVPGTNYATTSNTESDDMTWKWYFTEAGSDNWLTYYHIVNAVTGKYLYFRGELQTGNTNAFQTLDYSSENADRYQFVVAKTTESTTAGKYYIVPRVLQDLTYTNYSLVWRNGSNPLKTSSNRANDERKWIFEQTDYITCATPEISFDSVQGTATLTCATPGAGIYYVRYNSASGADPDLTDPAVSATLTLYDGTPVDMETYSYIKAIAARDSNGGDQSGVAGKPFRCMTPTIFFDYLTGQVIITSTTGSTIYYTTDGTTDPSVNQTENYGTSPVSFSLDASTTIKAIAVKGEGTQSVMAEEIIYKTATPQFHNEGAQVTITCATPASSIYYEIGDDAASVPTPTLSSTLYTGPLTNVTGKYIKAIAVRYGWIISDVAVSEMVTLKCATPVIRRGLNNTFTIECSFPTEEVAIHYTYAIDGTPADPNANSSTYSSPVHIDGYPITVKAIAVADGYVNSEIATQTITQNLEPTGDWYEIASAGDFNLFVNLVNGSGAGYNYRVTADFTVSNPSAVTQTFTGKFDGAGHIITGMTHPLFGTTNGAVIHDVNLKGVSITSTSYSADTVGAIACVAKGYTRIYNCGILPNTKDFLDGDHPAVSATKCAGSIVGSLRDYSRVVNCFSYADVSTTSTSNTTRAAGIVGYNAYVSSTSGGIAYGSTAKVTNGKYTQLRTMIVNCMFYGDITSANVYPVYGGSRITNSGANGINNYDFYSDSCTFHITTVPNPRPDSVSAYNCSWPARYEYLTRYEFHRSLLNSNRELCGWWVGSDVAPSTLTTTEVQAIPKDASLMAKWVLDPSVAPYPILKPFGKYFSPINLDADAGWRVSANEWEGKRLGLLSVTVKSGDHSSASDVPLSLVITDMDTLRGDYCYRKVQLPYYNTVFGNPNGEDWTTKYAGNYTDYVVTGWEITDVTGGTEGTYVEDWQYGYNFADRDCTKKDKYSVSGRIFAQGGFYYVPNGVTAITIKAHWAKAYYFSNWDYYYDRVDFKHNENATAAIGQGTAFAPAGIRSDLTENNGVYTFVGNGQRVLTGKIKAVADSCHMSAGSVFDNALVLIGNHQYCTGDQSVDPSCSFTLMSPDFDFDNEPDYCLDWQLGIKTNRYQFCPLRIDFLPVVEIGLGLKKDGSTQYYSLGCYRPLGHFEVTETALIRFGQYEFSNINRQVYAPLILNGGIYEQYVKSTKGNAVNGPDDKIDYIILGGNVYMFGFTPGAHVNEKANISTRHCAVNALGGKFNKFFLSGYFNENVSPNQDNPHAYIDGGWFDHMASAGKEGIYGDVTWRINHARINEFYGGGVMSQSTGNNYKIVKGSIDVVIDNSIVDKYCGGPKFGDMEEDKTVTTRAKGTTFGVYYGAGNGGTNYVQYHSTDNVSEPFSVNKWNDTVNYYYHPKLYREQDHSYEADFEYEVINTSTGTQSGIVVNRSYYYSAQFAATNTGTVTNTLDSCIVKNNFYGAGNLGGVNGSVTSTLTDTEVRGSAYGGGFSASIPEVTIYNTDKSKPVVDVYTGIITPSMGGTSTTYTWCYKNFVTNEVVPEGVVPPGDVGTDHPDFQYNNKNYFFTEVPLIDLGKVSGNVSLTIKGNSIIGTVENGVLKEDTGNVFGGGDESAVAGNTTVKLHDKTHVYGDVFGGGNVGRVDGNASVTIEDEP